MKNHTAFIKACKQHGITLNPKKVKMGLSEAKLLGRTVSGNGITVHDDNLNALRHCHEPTDVSGLRSFLGITNYANRHVKRKTTPSKHNAQKQKTTPNKHNA